MKLLAIAGSILERGAPTSCAAGIDAAVALVDGGDPAELDHSRGQACALLASNRAVVAPPRLCPANFRASAR